MLSSPNAQNARSVGVARVDQLNQNMNASRMKRVFRDAGKFEKAHQQFGLHLWYDIEFDQNNSANELVSTYRSLSEFEIVEPVLDYHRIGPENIVVGKQESEPLVAADSDPLFTKQWHYQNTGQTGGTPGADISLIQAWSIQSGRPNVVVAVIDGGIDVAHPDLAASMWRNANEIAGNGIDDDKNGYVDDINGYGFGDNTGRIYGDHHGTHVGGTIAAVNNNGVGVSGVAGGSSAGNGVRLMSCAAFGKDGVGGFEDAMIYAADNGAVISQNSWGGGSTSIQSAIDYFVARAGYDNTDANYDKNIQVGPMAGGIVIFAAGNSNSSSTSIGYPGSYPSVMAVASTDHNDVKSNFSNYGAWVDIAAPGSSIYSTYPVALGSYATLSGTSMACPHVSGVAALIVSQFGGKSLKAKDVWSRLQSTTDPIESKNPDFKGMLGSGRLNAFQALQLPDDIAPAAIKDLTIQEAKLNSLVIRWTAPGASGTTGAATSYDIRYSTVPITTANFSSAVQVADTPKPLVAGTVQEFEIKNLILNTKYYVAIKATDFFSNTSGISNIVNTLTLKPPVISVLPSTLSANLYTGGIIEKKFTILNTGLSKLYFDIESDEASSWLSPDRSITTVLVGATVEVKVSFNAAGLGTGDYKSTLTVNSNDPLTPSVAISTVLHVTGATDINIKRGDITFEDTYVNYGTTSTFLVENDGMDTLHVNKISITGSEFNVDATPFKVAPGDYKIMDVSFHPTSVGTFHGSIAMTSDDPDEAQTLISLKANGITPPAIIVTPASLSASMVCGEQNTQSIKLKNSGTGILDFALVINTDVGTKTSITNQLYTLQEGHAGLSNSGQTVTSDLVDGPYITATGDYTPKANSPVPLTNITIDKHSGLIYGQHYKGTEFYQYEPETNTWSQLESSPLNSGNNGGATFLHGKIYTVYAQDGSSIGVYDIASDRWSLITNGLGLGTTNITADDQYIYLIAGNEFSKYDPSSSTWTKLNTPPFLFELWGGISAYNNKIYGHQGNGLRGFAVYDINSNSWETLPEIPGGAVQGSAIDSFYGIYYAYGSYGGNNLYSFNINKKEWSVSSTPFLVDDGGMAGAVSLKQRGVYLLQGQNGTELVKFQSASVFSWLKVNTADGVLQPGEEKQIAVTVDGNEIVGGTYHASIDILHNDPSKDAITVPVNVTITGVPQVEIPDADIEYGKVYLNVESDSVVVIYNRGTDVLTLNYDNSDSINFKLLQKNISVPAKDSLLLHVLFQPASVGSHSKEIVFTTNDPGKPQISITLTGEGIFNPLQVSPSSIVDTVVVGQSISKTVAINNLGSETFNWRIGVEGTRTESLDKMLLNLNEGFSNVTDLIPNRYDFTQGDISNFISSGGEDMYDGGNYISTDVGGIVNYVDYTNGTLVNDSKFGASGKYFTAKYPGLFVMSADIDIDVFYITGDLGADGIGEVDATILTTSLYGKNYLGFVKRVYNAIDPSVNHLVIVDDNGSAGYKVIDDTNDDFHIVGNLKGAKRLYYLVFSSKNGGYIDNDAMQSIMTTFIQTISQNVSWVSLSKKNGTLLPGQQENINVTLDSKTLEIGLYEPKIKVYSTLTTATNNLSVKLTVTDFPKIEMSTQPVEFAKTYIGASNEKTIIVKNVGNGTLILDTVLVSNPAFSINPSHVSVKSQGQIELKVTYTPSAAGEENAKIKFFTNDVSNKEITITATASAVQPPLAEITPDPLEVVIFKGGEKTVSVKVKNKGGDELRWKLSHNLPDWVELYNNTSTVGSQQEQTIAFVFNSKDLPIGATETCNLIFTYNHPTDSVVTVPVTVHVKENNAPLIVTNIPDQFLKINDAPITLNLNEYVIDDKDDVLRYEIVGTENIVAANVENDVLYLTPNEEGNSILTIKAMDAVGAYVSTSFSVMVSSVTGILKEVSLANFNTYPNPVIDNSTVAFDLKVKSYVNLVLLDEAGRKIETLLDGDEVPGHKEVNLNGHNLNFGVYFLKMTTADGVTVDKIVKAQR
jgi:subtilisin family serine protease